MTMTVMTDILKVFEYNQHFVAMMNIINAARLNPPVKGHKHHIIPRCWFKMMHLPIDNSDDNLVLLTKEQHMKVHKLAAMCIIGSDMRSAMGFAVHILHGSFIGMHHSAETRRKLSESHKGKTLSKETRIKLSELHKGKHHSEEHRKKIAESLKGKQHSEEHRRKLSESLKGRTLSEDIRRKLSASHKGKVMSAEARIKMSESHKGENNPNYCKHLSEDTRKKLSESHKGMHWKLVDGKRVWYYE